MSGSSFRYFATADEIKKCFLDVEKNRKLKYIKHETDNTKGMIIYHSITEIPNLGINTTGNQSGDIYCVMDDKYKINFEKFKIKGGIKRFCVYEGMNPNSITVRFNGFYGDDCLIWNLVETMKGKESPISYSLFTDIKKSLRKIMKRAAFDCYISEKAEELYWNSNGKLRLTGLGADSPKEDDIKLEDRNKK